MCDESRFLLRGDTVVGIVKGVQWDRSRRMTVRMTKRRNVSNLVKLRASVLFLKINANPFVSGSRSAPVLHNMRPQPGPRSDALFIFLHSLSQNDPFEET
jgi:hypothetical protein